MGAQNGARLCRAEHSQVRIEGGFWGERLERIHGVTVRDVLGKFERDHGDGLMKNYEWVAEGRPGKHIGPPWYDGLICETIRGISDIIAHSYDAELDEKLDGYVEKIAAAQAVDPDGYINTYGSLICPDKRWGERGGSLLWQHELYNIGCLTEAGVHHYRATGKTRLLQCAVKAANCLCGAMGDGKKNIVPAHSLAEEAFIKLHDLLLADPALALSLDAKPRAYLALVKYWMDHRGVHADRASFPHYMGEYAQDHRPVLEQTEAVGHAVRAALMYTGLAALGIRDDAKYLEAAKRLWDNIVQTKLHISGGIGAVHNEERFGYQYDLPNDAYLETCAAVALCFFAGEMHRGYGDAGYMDVFERALYNCVLPGLSLDGTRYFYENPLISDGSVERWDWHDCPCCPPMFLKLMGALPDYVYSTDPDGLYVNLFIGSTFRGQVHGRQVTLQQADCQAPWSGTSKITLRMDAPARFALRIRVPEWAIGMRLDVAGQRMDAPVSRGYMVLDRLWQDGDAVCVTMEMPAVRIEAHPYVQADRGRVALMRGPLLYCLEAQDNAGEVDSVLTCEPLNVTESALFGGCKVIEGSTTSGRFLAIPYCFWANREKGKMAVWLRQLGLSEEGFSARYNTAGVYAAHAATGAPDARGWENRLYRVYSPQRATL